MAENTKLRSFLLIAALCVGICLVLFVGIPVLTNAQSSASPVPEMPVPTTPVPEPPESFVPPTPEVTAFVSPTLSETVNPPASVTTSPSIAKTATPTVARTTPAPTQAVAAPAAGDPIVGTWAGSKTMTIVIVSVQGSGTATFRDDFSGSASGEFHGAGRDGTFGADFVWVNLGSGKYRGNYGDKSLEFTLSDDVLTMTVNPKKLGVMDSEIMNMDIPFEMYRI